MSSNTDNDPTAPRELGLEKNMTIFMVLVQDGQGQLLQASGIKNATKQAMAVLGCKKADLHFVTIGTESGYGFDAYFFDNTKGDLAYWVAALKPANPVLSSGPVPNG